MKLSADAAKPIWLACQLEQMLPLREFWPLYQRRFNIEHSNRFAKLWLAREIVQDNPLPWQKPLPQNSLTPGRVALGFGAILAVIGTPACFPKTRGKSQGWPKGKKRTPKIPYPTVKKRYSAPPKSKKTAS
ncbi:MAG: hypothetical protein GPJ34_25970 [Microcystis aeruginosa LL11-07]|nr:hypothetical protein [Microcystis aeruginosa LL11-07]